MNGARAMTRNMMDSAGNFLTATPKTVKQAFAFFGEEKRGNKDGQDNTPSGPN